MEKPIQETTEAAETFGIMALPVRLMLLSSEAGGMRAEGGTNAKALENKDWIYEQYGQEDCKRYFKELGVSDSTVKKWLIIDIKPKVGSRMPHNEN